MMKLLRTIKTDKSGASAAEYALMIALIGGVIVIAASALGSGIGGVFTTMGSTLTAHTSTINP